MNYILNKTIDFADLKKPECAEIFRVYMDTIAPPLRSASLPFAVDGPDDPRRRWWEYCWTLANTRGELPEKAAVLDAGCAMSPFSLPLLVEGHFVHCVDLSDIGRRYDMARMLGSMERMFVYPGTDICEMPFPNDMFDATYCISVLEHIPDDEKALAELVRVTKPGGLLTITFDYRREPVERSVPDRLYCLDDIPHLMATKGLKPRGNKSFVDGTDWSNPPVKTAAGVSDVDYTFGAMFFKKK